MNETTIAQQLNQDVRVEKAKKLLIEAVQEHQKQIKGVRPPLPGLKQPYHDLIADLEQYRGAKLWVPYLGTGFGKGALVELMDGSIKYDFICGIGPHYLGHNHPELLLSGIDASLSNTLMQGHLQQNVDTLDLIELLIKESGMDHCFLTTSGAMANENALKVAFQKNYPAYRILAFDRCFVGRSLTISQISDKPTFREGQPPNVYVDYIPFFDPTMPEESIANSTATLKKFLVRYPKQYAAMCFELVQGEAGFYSATKAYFEALMTILKDNNIAVFDDEVQCFGRLNRLFAFQYFGLEQFIDIVSIGKVSQVCATLFTGDYQPRPGLLSQTFTGSTSAIKGAKAILRYLLEGGFFGEQGKIEKIHSYFAEKLKELSRKYPSLVKGPYGVGCMLAFTFAEGNFEQTTRFLHALFEAGVIGFIAGVNPARVRFLLPAGAITHEDMDKAAKIIDETLAQMEME